MRTNEELRNILISYGEELNALLGYEKRYKENALDRWAYSNYSEQLDIVSRWKKHIENVAKELANEKLSEYSEQLRRM